MAVSTVNAFSLRGFEVVILGKEVEAGMPQRAALPPRCSIEFVSTESTGRIRQIVKTYKEVWQISRKSNRVDCLIAYNAPAPLLLATMTLGRLRGITVVAHCTEWYADPPLRAAPFESLGRRLDVRLRMKVLHRHVDGMIASSRFLQRYYADHVPVLVVPTLSDVLPSEGGERCGDIPRIVYAGIPFRLGARVESVTQLKDRLDRALSYLDLVWQQGVDFRFDIYGPTKEQYLDALPEQAAMLERLDGLVTFHGFLSADVIDRQVEAADFTMLLRDPNRVTLAGFPTKFTESVNSGTPVITDATGDVRDYLIEGDTGFLLPGARSEAVDKLCRILSLSAEERAQAKQRCRRRGQLRSENWSNQLGEFVEDLIGASPRRAGWIGRGRIELDGPASEVTQSAPGSDWQFSEMS